MTREEAREYLIDISYEFGFISVEDFTQGKEGKKMRESIEILSQEPKTKVGKWIESHVPESVLVECSECGFSCGAQSFNYCPVCGAKMESEVEE